MRTADRYILRELAPPFVLGLGAFLVLLVGDILYTLAEYIVSGRMPPAVVGRLLLYKLPAMVVLAFPIATLFAALLGLGRLVRDRELEALRLLGVSAARVFVPVLAFGLGVGAVTFAINEAVAPWANQRASLLLRRALVGEALPRVREQIFLRAPGGRVLFIRRVDQTAGRLEDVMVFEPAGALPRLITAEEAGWTGEGFTLRRGVVRELDARGFTRYEAAFEMLTLPLGLPADALAVEQRTPEEMTLRELRRQIRLFGADLSPRVAIEYHRKMAVPAASLIFALVGAPLAVLATRGGRFVGVGLSVVLLFVYYAVMSTARALGAAGALPPVLAAWAPNLLFCACGAALIAGEDGRLRRRWGPGAWRPARAES
ncbi:MAG: LptF/LptG family permease [Armatimonadota bacterium]|nr:LptF/LptG family permease [Armatimonadota bacterium]MDR7534321.1 LptF/LptG family permease [Armatimonadota bacterium]MDR7537491.1 LptF/LptG family permease [Armatimonadota bacterium]